MMPSAFRLTWFDLAWLVLVGNDLIWLDLIFLGMARGGFAPYTKKARVVTL